jgi:hypothetical protein
MSVPAFCIKAVPPRPEASTIRGPRPTNGALTWAFIQICSTGTTPKAAHESSHKLPPTSR